MEIEIGLFEAKDKRPEGFCIYQNGCVEGSTKTAAVWIEHPGPALRYNAKAIDMAKHICAMLCVVHDADPIKELRGEFRGLHMPSFRQGAKNVIQRSKKKPTELY